MITCKYIMRKENDPELICYNGLYTGNYTNKYLYYLILNDK